MKSASRPRRVARLSLLVINTYMGCLAADPVWHSIGPFGGGSQVVAIDPATPTRLYTITSNSFLYRSEDEGVTWRAIRFPAQQAASAHALVINPTNPAELWIAVSSANPNLQGIYKSTDSGANWHHLDGLKGQSVFSLALYPKNPDIIAAGARDGVHLSRDQGATWNRISPLENKELQPVMSLAFDPRNERTLYAGTPHLPWKTEDNGATWRSIHKGMIDDSDILALIVNPKQPSQLFIGACSGIYRTDNSATLWTKLLGITGAGYRTYAVAQDPNNPNTIFSGTRDGLWKSTDGGKTWRKTSPHIVKSIAISPVDSKKLYLATQDAGMLRSNDGGETITEGQDGFADHRMSEIALSHNSLYVTGAQARVTWRIPLDALHKGHRAWSKLALPTAGQRVTLHSSGMALYVLTGSGMHRSLDQGATWTRLTPLPTPATSLAVLSDKEVIASTAKALYHSIDAGLTWKPLSPPSGPIVHLFTEPGEQSLIVETPSGFDFYPTPIAKPTKLQLPVRPAEVTGFVQSGDILVAATSQGILRSTDKGTSWLAIHTGIDPGTVAALTRFPNGALYAAQYGKVYRSQDDGESWQEITAEGLDETSIARLAAAPAGRLIALTPSRGVFVLEGSRITTTAGAEASGSRNKP